MLLCQLPRLWTQRWGNTALPMKENFQKANLRGTLVIKINEEKRGMCQGIDENSTRSQETETHRSKGGIGTFGCNAQRERI
jgi:phosphoribosylformimino-5-aminoimidazole carboxamide ribonucleotide (ProFAR) isomerase